MRKTLAAVTLATGLALAPALDAVNAQEETVEASDDGGGKWGLLGLGGLLGLAGLAGLKRRDRSDTGRDYTTGTGGSSTTRP